MVYRRRTGRPSFRALIAAREILFLAPLRIRRRAIKKWELRYSYLRFGPGVRISWRGGDWPS